MSPLPQLDVYQNEMLDKLRDVMIQYKIFASTYIVLQLTYSLKNLFLL